MEKIKIKLTQPVGSFYDASQDLFIANGQIGEAVKTKYVNKSIKLGRIVAVDSKSKADKVSPLLKQKAEGTSQEDKELQKWNKQRDDNNELISKLTPQLAEAETDADKKKIQTKIDAAKKKVDEAKKKLA